MFDRIYSFVTSVDRVTVRDINLFSIWFVGFCVILKAVCLSVNLNDSQINFLTYPIVKFSIIMIVSMVTTIQVEPTSYF